MNVNAVKKYSKVFGEGFDVISQGKNTLTKRPGNVTRANHKELRGVRVQLEDI